MSKHFQFRLNGEQFTVDSHNYHRNGIAGNGFDCIRFHRQRPKRDFIAIVFDDINMLAVIDPHEPEICWRGDDFEKPLREYLTIYDNKMKALFGATPTSAD